MKNKRNLKVYSKYTGQTNGMALNPEIRLTGKWVKDWGFNCGGKIAVRSIAEGIIVLANEPKVPPIINL